MEDKIKVYVPEEIGNTLYRDAEFFEFYKKDRQVNRNDFINTLIVNYHETYNDNETRLYERITESLLQQGESEASTAQMADRMVNLVREYQYSGSEKKTDTAISIKPTRRSAGTIDYIQASCLRNTSLSGYFRSMFVSYCMLPQDRREEIIFRDKFETVNRAIREGKMLYFTTARNSERHQVSPYAIARSQEELFNYMICIYNRQPYSFRITRIQNVRMVNQPSRFTDEERALLEKMRIYAPQFACRRQEEICVQLTKQGIRMFDKIYSYRPKPVNVIKDLYYFDCSAEQIYQYFFRFGRQARIIYPQNLRDWFYYDYHNAAVNYRPQKEGEQIEKQRR